MHYVKTSIRKRKKTKIPKRTVAELNENMVKFKTKDKFEDQLLVYEIISPRGISNPYITTTVLAINGLYGQFCT